MKHCKACQKPLARNDGERNDNWTRRVVCGADCRMRHMANVLRELDATMVSMPCKRCGKTVVRSSRFHSRGACPKCVDHFRQENSTRYRARRKEESRRYRVLMATLGFDDFAALIDYLRTVPWVEIDGRRVRYLKGAA
jgi:uncharacterized Zn finger protein (UPF0148 family)